MKNDLGWEYVENGFRFIDVDVSRIMSQYFGWDMS